uniref:Uncharacterized protein n=1 Tax=Globodera rostochiensis TaxID=31243 RepID=A0A914H4M7_GLORO
MSKIVLFTFVLCICIILLNNLVTALWFRNAKTNHEDPDSDAKYFERMELKDLSQADWKKECKTQRKNCGIEVISTLNGTFKCHLAFGVFWLCRIKGYQILEAFFQLVSKQHKSYTTIFNDWSNSPGSICLLSLQSISANKGMFTATPKNVHYSVLLRNNQEWFKLRIKLGKNWKSNKLGKDFGQEWT